MTTLAEHETALARLTAQGKGLLDYIYEADVTAPSIEGYLTSCDDHLHVDIVAGKDNRLFFSVSLTSRGVPRNPRDYGVGLSLENAWQDLWYWRDAIRSGKINW